MKAIVAVDKNWGIGKDGSLLISIPEDMKFFRETTSGHTVVMGRKTLESFPGGRPLKNRVNVVLTRNGAFEKEGCVIIHDRNELPCLLEGLDGEVFLIGGASVYRELLDMCDTAYVTKIDAAFDADVSFPDLDSDPAWTIAEQSEEKEYEGIKYRFVTYKKDRMNLERK